MYSKDSLEYSHDLKQSKDSFGSSPINNLLSSQKGFYSSFSSNKKPDYIKVSDELSDPSASNRYKEYEKALRSKEETSNLKGGSFLRNNSSSPPFERKNYQSIEKDEEKYDEDSFNRRYREQLYSSAKKIRDSLEESVDEIEKRINQIENEINNSMRKSNDAFIKTEGDLLIKNKQPNASNNKRLTENTLGRSIEDRQKHFREIESKYQNFDHKYNDFDSKYKDFDKKFKDLEYRSSREDKGKEPGNSIKKNKQRESPMTFKEKDPVVLKEETWSVREEKLLREIEDLRKENEEIKRSLRDVNKKLHQTFNEKEIPGDKETENLIQKTKKSSAEPDLTKEIEIL